MVNYILLELIKGGDPYMRLAVQEVMRTALDWQRAQDEKKQDKIGDTNG